MTVPPVAELIPHGPPMRLIDQILHSGTDVLWAATTPQRDSMFAHSAGMPACIGLEYLAQTAAAFFTLQAGEEPGEPRQGMLIACRDFQCKQPYFAHRVRLLLRVELQSNIHAAGRGHGLVKFHGEIFVAPESMPATPDITDLAEAADPLTVANLSVYL